MSSASPPRTSPTTSRSGRIRNAARTSSRTDTPPAPSALAGRASSRTTWGCASRSSAVSSIVTMRSSRVDGRCASALQHVVLPELVAPDTRTLQPARTTASKNATAGASSPNSASATGTRAEPPDREARTVGRERREHRVQPGAVGKPGVDHRRRPVEPQAERADHAFHDARDRRRVELGRHRFEPPVTLDEDATGTVHHDLGDVGIGEERLEHAETADLVDQRVEHASWRRPRTRAAPRRADAGPVRRAVRRARGRTGRTATRAAGAGARRATCERRHSPAPIRVVTPPARARCSPAGRAHRAPLRPSDSGRRDAKTPASTAARWRCAPTHVASTGRPSTSATSCAPSDLARLLEQHRAGRTSGCLDAHRAPQREVAPAHARARSRLPPLRARAARAPRRARACPRRRPSCAGRRARRRQVRRRPPVARR